MTELQGVLNGLAEGITVQDQSGDVVFANDAAGQALGFPDGEALLNANMADVVSRFGLLGDSASKTLPGRDVLLGETSASRVLHYRLLPSGDERWSHTYSQEWFHDGKRYVINHFFDVTEKMRYEAQLRFLSQASDLLSGTLDFERVLRQVPELIVPKLADWCAVEVVDAARSGIEQLSVAHVDPAKVAIGRRLRDAYPLQFDHPETLPRALREGVSELLPLIPLEYQLSGVTNPEHIELIKALNLRSAMIVPLKARGQVLGIITFVLSESNRQYGQSDLQFAEELAAKAAAAIDNARLYRAALHAISQRDEFLSIASHELRTPLTSLLLRKEALVRVLNAPEPQKERILHQIAPLERQLHRLSELVDALLDVSRLSQVGIRIEPQPIDLAPVVRDVLSRFETQFSHGGINVITGIESVTGAWDPLRIEQLVTNLVSNAIKYGGGNDITVKTSVEDGFAVITVSDRGQGISPQDLKRIFERFERVGAANDATPGLGLGLYIAQQIALAHGGDIKVESSLGEGATFTVRLPRQV
jgi:signal transduction histidine kinase